MLKYDWTITELEELYQLPFLDLIAKSHTIHAQFHEVSEIQVCNLISIKTGGCPEDCRYCAQSSRYQTPVQATAMMEYEAVLSEAKKAISRGATRICLGAAWRAPRNNKAFDEIIKMVKGITELGVEVCCTLGMIDETQGKRLKEAGLYAYNHNLDTSEKFYPQITSTRSYQDRLKTLDAVENANLSVCCGGILGMGESVQDRLELLLTLCKRNPHPESVPINRLSTIPGTPLENLPQISIWEMVRIVAIARIVMPKAMVRLSCGRIDMTYEAQALCFLAGANSIFSGEKLLTVANTSIDSDRKMFELLGLKMRPAFAKAGAS